MLHTHVFISEGEEMPASTSSKSIINCQSLSLSSHLTQTNININYVTQVLLANSENELQIFHCQLSTHLPVPLLRLPEFVTQRF